MWVKVHKILYNSSAIVIARPNCKLIKFYSWNEILEVKINSYFHKFIILFNMAILNFYF